MKNHAIKVKCSVYRDDLSYQSYVCCRLSIADLDENKFVDGLAINFQSQKITLNKAYKKIKTYLEQKIEINELMKQEILWQLNNCKEHFQQTGE